MEAQQVNEVGQAASPLHRNFKEGLRHLINGRVKNMTTKQMVYQVGANKELARMKEVGLPVIGAALLICSVLGMMVVYYSALSNMVTALVRGYMGFIAQLTATVGWL